MMLNTHYESLKDVAVVISGGSTGIGAALVRGFCAQKARVGFVDIDAQRGSALAAELAANGAKAEFQACDITDFAAYHDAIMHFARAHGPCQILLNNAANDQRMRLDELTQQTYERAIAVNLGHAMFAAQAVAPSMIEMGGGSIVNFGSVSWMMASGNLPIYAACKAGLHGLTRTLARDLGKHGIRVNTLVPGWVMTERQKTLWVDAEAEQLIDKSQCLVGHVLPEDIAAMALFLASDEAKMCSAQNFIVDGGWV
ncbi:SDR family NAD(P)-dependent oxidoreductase [Devosia algicola]|uniref:SDR family NAD(P)-dependent oxidoreductase n=1 Tax=Devosia algicola TaxID=3026418 RepID=A0ABY7YLI8_9HYPH|nr:SDR family oxidoreductase [Devosia algicola]WDR02168.1 SDR family NAD(P)-dependent oxidoreductase [Devosia algicola]